MSDDTEAAEDERIIELSSIAAIFPELIIDQTNSYRATLDLPVTPVQPLKIRFAQSVIDSAVPNVPAGSGKEEKKSTIPEKQATVIQEVYELAHLPPLSLDIKLPQGYPGQKPPEVEIKVIPQWLPKSIILRLQHDCEKLWQDIGQDQVVYTFIDHLQQEAENTFGLTDDGRDFRGIQLSSDLKLALLDFDLKTKREKFEAETFDCRVCLEPKKGKDCHRLLLCGHVFCIACLQDCYNNSINEGDVDMVKCLVPGCGKENAPNPQNDERPAKRRKQDRTLNPSELMQIPLEQELVQRFVRLKRKKKIEADKNTIYCPRQWCQGAAKSKKHPKPLDPLNDANISSSESDEEKPIEVNPPKGSKKNKHSDDIPMAERLAVCEDCNFAFCSVCKKGWHGVLSLCNPRREAELRDEEKATVEYLSKYSTPCPTCNAPCQKSMGCNHMICFRCKTHFCYLCSAYLMPDNPYKHFNEWKSTCYMRLWELEAGDGDRDQRGLDAAPRELDWDFDELGSDFSDDSSEDDDDDDDNTEDNFAEFGGDEDEDMFRDDDTDDSEPAPDQRRAERGMHIEIVNYARDGAAARRFDLPERPRLQQPNEVVPARPQNGRRQVANHARNHAPRQARARGNPPQRQVHEVIQVPPPPAAPVPPEEAENDFIQAIPAPGQGNNGDAALQRFLRLALQDREDEWDSDELEDMEPQDIRRPIRRGRR